jgi:hypothetical protein
MRKLTFTPHLVVLVVTASSLFPGIVIADSQDWLASSYAAGGDFFGRSIALSGDTMLVGAYGSNAGGSASVFIFDGFSWIEQARFRSDAFDDSFGYAVALDGDTALVGAYGTSSDSGAVYIYARYPAGYWKQQAVLTGKSGERFGYDVALSGNTVVVGTDTRAEEDGTAYVFVRTGSFWQEEAELTAPGTAGNPVSIDSNHLLLGAYRKDSFTGAAYVFTRTGGTWAQAAELASEDSLPGDWFGSDVSMSSGRALVGACRKAQSSGAAYVFLNGRDGWEMEKRLAPPTSLPDDHFGAAVALSEDMAVVGAFHSLGDQGQAYLFRHGLTGWSQAEVVSPLSLMPRDWFGYAAAIDGQALILGAPTRQDQGMVYSALANVEQVSLAPVAALPATGVDTRSAVLNCVIKDLGFSSLATAYFEYGSFNPTFAVSTRYSRVTPAQTVSAAGPLSQPVAGLSPNTSYHFRVVVETDEGIAFGPDQVFLTPPLEPASTTIMVAPPVFVEPPSPIFLWLAANFKIYAPVAVLVIIISIIASKHREDRQRVLRARTAFNQRPVKKSNYDNAVKKIASLIDQRKAGLISEAEYAALKSDIIKGIDTPEVDCFKS